MKSACQHFLPRAAFAPDEHRGGRRRDACHGRQHFFHGRTFGDESGRAEGIHQGRTQLPVLHEQVMAFEGRAEGEHQLVQIDRLVDVVERSRAHGAYG